MFLPLILRQFCKNPDTPFRDAGIGVFSGGRKPERNEPITTLKLAAYDVLSTF